MSVAYLGCANCMYAPPEMYNFSQCRSCNRIFCELCNVLQLGSFAGSLCVRCLYSPIRNEQSSFSEWIMQTFVPKQHTYEQAAQYLVDTLNQGIECGNTSTSADGGTLSDPEFDRLDTNSSVKHTACICTESSDPCFICHMVDFESDDEYDVGAQNQAGNYDHMIAIEHRILSCFITMSNNTYTTATHAQDAHEPLVVNL